MKKNEVSVRLKNLKEAKFAYKILKELGENVRHDYFTNTGMSSPDLELREGGWILGFSSRKQVTLKELIKIISSEEEKPKELEVGKWYWLKHPSYDLKALINFQGFERESYGFDHYGIWCNDYNSDETILSYNPTLATDKDVFEALSKEAERRYKGKKAKCLHGFKDYDHNSDFNSLELNKYGALIYGIRKGGIGCLFHVGKWAKIIEQHKSILDGEVAIQVNNKREFELLMKHYEEKGWRNKANEKPSNTRFVDNVSWSYRDNFGWAGDSFREREGYKTIPFEDFAKEVGDIEVPKFALKSEDGVDLYYGDQYYFVVINENKASICKNSFNDLFIVLRNSLIISCPEIYKAFSTKEAALKFVEEFNKPKEIDLFEDQPAKVKVNNQGFHSFGSGVIHGFSGEELEQIYQAYKSLQ